MDRSRRNENMFIVKRYVSTNRARRDGRVDVTGQGLKVHITP